MAQRGGTTLSASDSARAIQRKISSHAWELLQNYGSVDEGSGDLPQSASVESATRRGPERASDRRRQEQVETIERHSQQRRRRNVFKALQAIIPQSVAVTCER